MPALYDDFDDSYYFGTDEKLSKTKIGHNTLCLDTYACLQTLCDVSS